MAPEAPSSPPPQVCLHGCCADHAAPAPRRWRQLPLALAGLAAAGAEGAHWAQAPLWLQIGLAILALGLCGPATWRKGWQSWRAGRLDMQALMSVAVLGAVLIGQWAEAAMVLVLFTLAERLEAYSLARAQRAIEGLLTLAPPTATVRQADGSWQSQPAAEITVGSLLRVAPGERIALDGRVTAGESSVNQAPITGESLPVAKTVGDPLFAGTINQQGTLHYTATALAADSTLARILHAVQAAQSSRAPWQQLVDRFARIYTPLVLLLAAGVALLPPLLAGGAWAHWLYQALALLVIACPCALVISTPVTLVSGLAAAARHGLLIKGGRFLEQGRLLTDLALDKTGTLTRGRPEVVESCALAGEPEAGVALAVSLAAHSDHPLSRALCAAWPAIPRQEVAGLLAQPGQGLRGQIDGERYLLGNYRLIAAQGLADAALAQAVAAREARGESVLLLADRRSVRMLFALADTLRPEAAAVVAELQAQGLRLVVLSGDNPGTAQAIAAQAGIAAVQGGLLPEEKQAAVAALRGPGRCVGMVGDGINDAPALAQADIGLAMGAAGSDTAIETADVALMDDDLHKLPRFIRLSRATHAVLRQNLLLAVGIKGLFLALTLAGLGSLWLAVFADVGASLLVIGNGLRLSRR